MRHLAIIPDGNGRWAKSHDLPVGKGHERGAIAVTKVIEDFCSLPIDVLTIYALSRDNLKRDREEVGNLHGVIAYFLSHDIARIAEQNGLKIRIIGDLSLFPDEFAEVLSGLNARFLNGSGKTVVIAVGYGGRAEIKAAVDRILDRRRFLDDYSPVTDEELDANLFTAGLPAPDAVLRYGGYHRLSDFMPLQTTYSELFFVDKFWPDYERTDIESVIDEFSRIKRNFGGRHD